VKRGLRLRDGSGIAVENSEHPDTRAEAVRWAIAEGECVQAYGRVRGVNRGPESPVQIDILTNLALPGIEVDETVTWESIQPTLAQTMAARGAVPVSYAGMAVCHPDLFPSAGAAEQALRRENPLQTPIEEYLYIGVCRGFLSATYRKDGTRGPAGRLLYDPRRVEPAAWLTERLGDVTVPSLGEPLAADAGNEPATAPAAPAARLCGWFIDTTGDTFQRCGELITDGRDWCPRHRQRSAAVLTGDWTPPITGVANSNPELDWDAVLDAAAGDMPDGSIPYRRVAIEDIFVCAGLEPPEDVDWGVEDVVTLPAWVA
jgi:hypothetical protein